MKRTATAVLPKFALLVATLAMSACGGGGNERGPLPSGFPSGPQGTIPSSQARFVITVPPKTTSGASRMPQYISPSSQSLTISVNGGTSVRQNLTPASQSCSSSKGTLQCTATIAAPVGSDTFAVTTYDRPDGAGHILSTAGAGPFVIDAGVTTTVPIVLAGVVATIALAVNPKSLTTGAPATSQLTVTAKDADGNTIVGPGGYENAISLVTSGDAASEVTLSTSSLTGPPAGPVTVKFNGGATAETVTFTGSATGAASASATLAIDAPQFMYVVEYSGGNGVFVFPTSARGNVAPVRTITNTNTSSTFFGPFDAVDNAGNLYVDTFGSQGNAQPIYVYAAGANGNASPVRSINYVAPGGVYGLFIPEGLAIDNARHELYVYDFNLPGIEVFSLGTSGSSTPIRIISGSNTNIVPVGKNQAGIALDSVGGELYVEARSGVLVFPQSASGNVAPTRTITTSAYAEIGLGVGPITRDLFESAGYGALNVYGPAASGNATPLRQITGSNTGIGVDTPGGLALDSAENVYLANENGGVFAACTFAGQRYGEILIWGPTDTGNVAPDRYLCGPNTGFLGPEAVAIGP